MKLGLFTPVFGNLDVPTMLSRVKALQHVTAIELGTGGWPGSSHLDLDKLLANAGEASSFKKRITDAGLQISALSCHNNPLHPEAGEAKEADDTIRKSVRLAERLGVPIEREGFETVGGFLLSRLGRVPVVGESFEVDGLSVEVLEAERRRITKVRIRRLQPVHEGAPEGKS